MFLCLSHLCLSRPCLVPPPLPWSPLLQEGLMLVTSVVISGVHARTPMVPPHSPCSPTTASSMVSTNPLFLPRPSRLQPLFSQAYVPAIVCSTLRCSRRATLSSRWSSRRVSAWSPRAVVGWNSTSSTTLKFSAAVPRPMRVCVPLCC